MVARTIILRPLRDSDAEIHATLPHSEEIAGSYGAAPGKRAPRNLTRSRAWLGWMRSRPFGRIIEVDGRPVGEARLHSVTEDGEGARLAIGLFWESDLGQGIGRAAIALVLDHGFGPMGLRRIDLRVLDYNVRAIRCYTACGFVQTGVEPRAVLRDGRWFDDLIMEIDADMHHARKSR
ncbi:GNAT family N-acetyltransferase [Hasllibacter sp. MH4015]|uniref:GNAT family N-acetyltransferase n=1 Tax=Hasllibacter sp. MH4015 TaxID=2854029 RepID=UPI001CD1DA8D|nr:GNAT family protein [Hasllibacter sp. MH4015]